MSLFGLSLLFGLVGSVIERSILINPSDRCVVQRSLKVEREIHISLDRSRYYPKCRRQFCPFIFSLSLSRLSLVSTRFSLFILNFAFWNRVSSVVADGLTRLVALSWRSLSQSHFLIFFFFFFFFFFKGQQISEAEWGPVYYRMLDVRTRVWHRRKFDAVTLKNIYR